MTTQFKPAKRWPVAILGATGAVGQTFIRLLANHPWFEIAEVAASERSEGKPYAEAAKWLEGKMPESVARLTVLPTDPARVASPIVFSALDSSVAGTAELAFAKAGRFVLSNAKNFRMDADVPLVIPEVNASHLQLIDCQRKARGWSGAIVTNANCAATVAALALAPLEQQFGIDKLFMTTMQAVSGAGYPGVPSLDILGNVIPYIADEEPKFEKEMFKLLGKYENGSIAPPDMKVSAQCNRVPVEHGHTIAIAVSFHTRITPAIAIEAIRAWKGDPASRDLPSSPVEPIAVTDDPSRPQPRRDVNAGNGMTVTVGRVREDPILDIRMVAMGHNTIRGAAGGSVLNAEVLAATGRLGAA
jgi:aspartate-semialdehyde dehydrogenase